MWINRGYIKEGKNTGWIKRSWISLPIEFNIGYLSLVTAPWWTLFRPRDKWKKLYPYQMKNEIKLAGTVFSILLPPLLMCTWFLKNRVWKIKLDELDFLSISNLTFTACVACKIRVQNRQKIKFIQLDFLTWFFKNQVQINRGLVLLFYSLLSRKPRQS